ncbi:MAG: response regulator transcription factor [Clostridia bacterium]|nr:response regulator transcription factor [Clostridia bacterium]
MPTILLIEDEEKLARFIELELKHEGYDVMKEFDGRLGLTRAEENDVDLILLDIMLPSLNGLEVLRRLRKSKNTPVIMLTARDAVMDKVTGLDMGADDYMTKPFSIEELLARIRAALRKGAVKEEEHDSLLCCEDLEMDVKRHAVRRNRKSITLTGREFTLLQCFLENQTLVLSREQLLEKVWGYDYVGETNIVDVYIRYLRSKVDDGYSIKLLHTVRGVGYTLCRKDQQS